MIDKERRHQPGQPKTRLVGAGPRISDVRAGGRAHRLCAGCRDVRRSRLSAGRRPHLWFSQKHHGRPRRRFLRLDGLKRRRARRRQAAICARDRAGNIGPAGLLRCHRCCGGARPRDRRRALGAGQPRDARRRLPPRRAGQGRTLSGRQCRDGEGAAGAASLHGDARMARHKRRPPPISSRQRSSIPRPAASSSPLHRTRGN